MVSQTKWFPALTVDEGVEQASALFVQSFGHAPDGVWAAPGRVNVIGEHVDYNGGTCLPIALPHAAYVAVSRREDSVVRIVDRLDPSEIVEVDIARIDPSVPHGQVKGWAGYLAGVAWAFGQEKGRIPGMDIALFSCVPLGAGLSSSAALECSVAIAIDDLFDAGLQGNEAGQAELVNVARRAENEVVGAHTGGLDQSASIRCIEGYALVLDCRDMSASQTPFDLASSGATLLVVDTRAPHSLVDGQYGQRRADCEAAAGYLGVGQLVEVEDYESAMNRLLSLSIPSEDRARLVARTRHVLSEIARTELFVHKLTANVCLDDDDLRFLGALMNDSHDSLREDYEVSCPELDCVVDVARACGAYGARMTGGGFGGSAIALVKSEHVEDIAQAIASAFGARGFRSPQFLAAPPSAGARRLL